MASERASARVRSARTFHLMEVRRRQEDAVRQRERVVRAVRDGRPEPARRVDTRPFAKLRRRPLRHVVELHSEPAEQQARGIGIGTRRSSATECVATLHAHGTAATGSCRVASRRIDDVRLPGEVAHCGGGAGEERPPAGRRAATTAAVGARAIRHTRGARGGRRGTKTRGRESATHR